MTRLPFSRRHLLAGVAGIATLPAGALPVLAQSSTSPASTSPASTIPAPAAGAPRRGGVLRVSVDQAASVIHPLRSRVNPEYLVTELLYSNLTRLKPDMTPEPDLATAWTPNADLTEWRFTLRQGVVFHDGTPCTATDVAATFKAILDPKTASPARTNVGPIASVEAVDAQTVLFRLSAPYADLPVAVAYTSARIIPARFAEGDLDALARQAVGTGPFKLVSYEPDRRIIVTRNEQYYDPARPYQDRVEVMVFPDSTAEASALLSGDTDLMSNAGQGEFPRLSSARGVKALRVPSGQFLNVNMDCAQPPFNDVRVRRALALAMDREAMVGFVAQGYGTPGNDVPMNAAYHFHKEFPLKKPDIAAGKRLLAEAGHPRAARGGDAGDGAAGRLPHQRADHAARHLPGPGVEERQLLCWLLQHAGDSRRHLLPALHLRFRLERNPLEQRRLRQAGTRGTRDGGRGEAARPVRCCAEADA